MIAAGIDFDKETVRIVKIAYGPRGISSVSSATMPIMEFEPRDVKADVIGINRWQCVCMRFWPETTLVPVTMAKSKREPLLERYDLMRPAFMDDCNRQAGLNAFIAAFGTDW